VISVILCTHNPKRNYLRRTLEGLRQQSLACTEWEFILIDNLSDTVLSMELDLSWHPNVRVIREEKLGLTPARLRGIRESRGSLLVFVDDDNVLDDNYLEEALRVAEERPFLGSWSGQCRPEFQEKPPEWTRRYWGNLVIREFHTDRWSNLPRLAETMPCGAGLCVRREVADFYLRLHDNGQRAFQFDRTGDSLVSGGDNDLAACACDIGLGIGLATSLKLTHLIPPERLTVGYLSRLAKGIHFSTVVLDKARGIPVQKRSFRRKLLDFLRTIKLPRPIRLVQRAALQGHDQGVEIASKL
jgi:glycosyltransferase involved in cell wall biosynthesis